MRVKLTESGISSYSSYRNIGLTSGDWLQCTGKFTLNKIQVDNCGYIFFVLNSHVKEIVGDIRYHYLWCTMCKTQQTAANKRCRSCDSEKLVSMRASGNTGYVGILKNVIEKTFR